MSDQPQLFDAGGPVRFGRKPGRPKGYVCSPETRAKMSAARLKDAPKRAATRLANEAKHEANRKAKRELRAAEYETQWSSTKDALLGKGYDWAVAIVLGKSEKAVAKRRYKLGIPGYQRPPGRRRRFTRDGYVTRVLAADDPLLSMVRSGRTVFEHRLIMARSLGRPLRQDEFVHHRNGNRSDNRLENLELWSRAHPDGRRVTDLVKFAREVLTRYDGF